MARPVHLRPALPRPTAPKTVHAPRIGWGGLALLLLAAGCAAGLLGWEALQESERLEGTMGAAALEAGADATMGWLQVRALIATAIAGLCGGAAIHFGRVSMRGWAERLRVRLLAVRAGLEAPRSAGAAGSDAMADVAVPVPSALQDGSVPASRPGGGRPTVARPVPPRQNSQRATNQDTEEPAGSAGAAGPVVGGSLQRKNPLSGARGPASGIPLRGGYSTVRHLPIPRAGSLLGRPETLRPAGVTPSEPSGVRILASWRPLDASNLPEAANPAPPEIGPADPPSSPSHPKP